MLLCPTCKVELRMTDRQGVEVDYCPQCRGVWLDRGELDKIIERSAAATPVHGNREEYAPHDRHDSGEHHGHKKHKKKSFLGDLFDFD